MLTRPKSILPFQIARDETGSWRALERRLAVERRRVEVFFAMVAHHSIRIYFRLFGLFVGQLEPRRGRTLAARPFKPRFAGAARCRFRRVRGRRAIELQNHRHVIV